VSRRGLLLLIRAVTVALALVLIGVGGWFSHRLTVDRPLVATSEQTVPFQTHGATTFISETDNLRHGMLGWGAIGLLGLYWLTELGLRRLKRGGALPNEPGPIL
jgi:hypothetical protein